MAEDNETRWQSLPPFLILLLFAVGSYWWMPWPLEGERPPQSYAGIPLEGVQQAEGRLWQDPFAVAQAHRLQEPAAGGAAPVLQQKADKEHALPEKRDLDWLGDLVEEKCSESRRCHVLGVMVFGGPHMGLEEYRRYNRYAVLAGLSQHGFIPEDTEHIGYVEPGDRFPPVLPFEWLSGESSELPPLLLLWLDEDALTREFYYAGSRGLESDMLPRLEKLLLQFENKRIQSFNIIGPASSGTLSKLAREWQEEEQEEDRGGVESSRDETVLPQISWYSASATSDEAWAKIEKAAEDSKRSITRVIAKDVDLAKNLVDELIRRGLESSDTVALIGQLDTEYSRNLIALLEEGLDDSFKAGKVQVVTARYLRGIDGEKPKVKGEISGKSNNKEKGDGSPRDDKVERPQGDGQIDYLRRLTTELARQHQAFKPSGDIKAVGILGDDYHDKLLVLKALRHAFPDAVFFTTDLEAAMIHPVDNRYTRNLVVASAFGLELEPALQAGFAPFRSSYQTASYLATRLAMENALSDVDSQALKQAEIDERISPLLFEIGRSAPVRLNSQTTTETEERQSCGPQRRNWLECTDWQPTRGNRPTKRTILGSVLAFVGGITLASLLLTRFRRYIFSHWRFLAVFSTLVAAFAAWLMASLPSPLGEPFSWVEGVSVWPTEILRMLSVVLSILLFVKGVRRLRRCDEVIDERFFGGQEREEPETDGGRFAPDSPRDKLTVPVLDIWRLYRARQFHVQMLTRRLVNKQTEVVPSWLKRHFVLQNLKPVAVHLAVGFGLVLALGIPQTPARGGGMFILDYIVLVTAVVSFLFLLYFTLDASRRAVWLAHILSKPTYWPQAVLKRFGWQEGQDEKYFNDFLDVQLLAEATNGVQRLVYAPFLIFFVLVFSRTRLFDGWHIPVSLYLIFAIAGLLMLFAAGRLRRAAEESRSRALENMNINLLRIQGQEEMMNMEQQMQTMIAVTKNTRKGAYSPIGEQPIVRAVLGLASGIYAIFFLEWMNMAGL